MVAYKNLVIERYESLITHSEITKEHIDTDEASRTEAPV